MSDKGTYKSGNTPTGVPLEEVDAINFGNIVRKHTNDQITTYGDKEIPKEKIDPSLTLSERNNLICSLFEKEILVYRDCETGILLIVK